MDITWLGQSCFRLKGKQTTVVTDPFDPQFTGLKLPTLSADIVTVSHSHDDHSYVQAVSDNPFVIQGPGEYEVKGVYIVGVSSWHDANEGRDRGRNVIYTISIDGVTVCHTGDLGQKLTPAQLESISGVDVLLIPVGGVYTIDAERATEVIAQIEPCIVIPMHYKVPELKFDLAPLEVFLHEMGKEDIQPVGKLAVTKEKLPTEMQVVVLEKQ